MSFMHLVAVSDPNKAQTCFHCQLALCLIRPQWTRWPFWLEDTLRSIKSFLQEMFKTLKKVGRVALLWCWRPTHHLQLRPCNDGPAHWPNNPGLSPSVPHTATNSCLLSRHLFKPGVSASPGNVAWYNLWSMLFATQKQKFRNQINLYFFIHLFFTQVLKRQGYDAACDIWSLGILLYTMLAG